MLVLVEGHSRDAGPVCCPPWRSRWVPAGSQQPGRALPITSGGERPATQPAVAHPCGGVITCVSGRLWEVSALLGSVETEGPSPVGVWRCSPSSCCPATHAPAPGQHAGGAPIRRRAQQRRRPPCARTCLGPQLPRACKRSTRVAELIAHVRDAALPHSVGKTTGIDEVGGWSTVEWQPNVPRSRSRAPARCLDTSAQAAAPVMPVDLEWRCYDRESGQKRHFWAPARPPLPPPLAAIAMTSPSRRRETDVMKLCVLGPPALCLRQDLSSP
jgi:hypothetical protein